MAFCGHPVEDNCCYLKGRMIAEAEVDQRIKEAEERAWTAARQAYQFAMTAGLNLKCPPRLRAGACPCGMPDEWDSMILCEGNHKSGDKWYHQKCMDVPAEGFEGGWYCPKCLQKESGEILEDDSSAAEQKEGEEDEADVAEEVFYDAEHGKTSEHEEDSILESIEVYEDEEASTDYDGEADGEYESEDFETQMATAVNQEPSDDSDVEEEDHEEPVELPQEDEAWNLVPEEVLGCQGRRDAGWKLLPGAERPVSGQKTLPGGSVDRPVYGRKTVPGRQPGQKTLPGPPPAQMSPVHMNAAEGVKKRKRYQGGYEDDGSFEENGSSEEDVGPPPPKRQRAPTQPPTVPAPPTAAPPAKKRRGKQRNWTPREARETTRHMQALVDERDHPSNAGKGLWPGETKFAETSRLLALQGIIRTPNSVKNYWNRGLRERSGVEERLKARGQKMTTGLRK